MSRLVVLIVLALMVVGCASSESSPSPASRVVTASPENGGASSQGPAEGCGVGSQPQGAPEVVLLYAGVWSEADTAERLAVLERIWAVDGSFVDPLQDEPVVGRDVFNEYLDGFTGAYPGYYFTLQAWTAGDLHHDRVRMRWNFCAPDDALLAEGTDFGVLGADGRWQSIASFFPLPWPDPPAR